MNELSQETPIFVEVMEEQGVDIIEILNRPHWSYEEAEARILANPLYQDLILAEQTKILEEAERERSEYVGKLHHSMWELAGGEPTEYFTTTGVKVKKTPAKKKVAPPEVTVEEAPPEAT